MTRALVIAALLLGACKKSSKPDCDGAGKAIEAATAEVAKNGPDQLARETAKRVGPGIAANVVLRCKEDSWSAAATDCVKAAKLGELGKCESKLSKEQLTKFKNTVGAIDGSAPPSTDTSATAGGAGATGSAEPPPGPPADCSGVEAAMTRYWNEQVSAAKTDAARKSAEESRVKARALISKHCTDDRWSFEAADCFTKAAATGDLASCAPKLTQHQLSELKMSAPAIPNPLPGPPAAPPPTAEDTGSGSAEAGSGSAAVPAPEK